VVAFLKMIKVVSNVAVWIHPIHKRPAVLTTGLFLIGKKNQFPVTTGVVHRQDT
jgi:hypothetical protein